MTGWLEDIKHNSPTYSREQFQQGIGTLNYYSTTVRETQAVQPRAPEVTSMQFDMRGLASIIITHAESMGGTLNFYCTAGDSSRRYGHEPQK